MNARSLPPGFTEHHIHRQVWWLKAGWEETFLEACAESTLHPLPSTPTLGGGRGALQRVLFRDGIRSIVRHYRRGGLVRHFLRDLYWDRPPRPLAELICTEVARQRGVPTVEVLGAGIEWSRFGLYRGIFITREAEGYCNLWEWLQMRKMGAEREAALAIVAHAIARLHGAGVAHADLNLTNVLVRTTTDSEALLIDFDRARVFPGPLPSFRRKRNLRRLRRSLQKLDPGMLFFSSADLKTFCHAYHERLNTATAMASLSPGEREPG